MAILRRTVLAGILVAAILIITGILLMEGIHQNQVASGHHVTEYTIRVSPDTPISNLTLVLPSPATDGSSSLGGDLVSGRGYTVPTGWNISLEYIHGSPMIRIVAPGSIAGPTGSPVTLHDDRVESGARLPSGQVIRPIPLATTMFAPPAAGKEPIAIRLKQVPGSNASVVSSPGRIPRTVEFGAREMTGRMIDTRDPIGSAPLLYPKGPLNATTPGPVPATGRNYAYTSPAYVDYTSDEPVEIEISASVTGINEWWDLGWWSSNLYSDRITVRCTGGEKGWVTAQCLLRTGIGQY